MSFKTSAAAARAVAPIKPTGPNSATGINFAIIVFTAPLAIRLNALTP